MRTFAIIVSWLSLVALTVPAIMFVAGAKIDLDMVKRLMFAATVLWFMTASTWMWNSESKQSS